MSHIPIGDWFLARSEAFGLLVERFKDHRRLTQVSFSRVKSKHYVYDRKLNELQARIKEVESILESLNAQELVKKKKK